MSWRRAPAASAAPLLPGGGGGRRSNVNGSTVAAPARCVAASQAWLGRAHPSPCPVGSSCLAWLAVWCEGGAGCGGGVKGGARVQQVWAAAGVAGQHLLRVVALTHALPAGGGREEKEECVAGCQTTAPSPHGDQTGGCRTLGLAPHLPVCVLVAAVANGVVLPAFGKPKLVHYLREQQLGVERGPDRCQIAEIGPGAQLGEHRSKTRPSGP